MAFKSFFTFTVNVNEETFPIHTTKELVDGTRKRSDRDD